MKMKMKMKMRKMMMMMANDAATERLPKWCPDGCNRSESAAAVSGE